jgi:hypothetical protein
MKSADPVERSRVRRRDPSEDCCFLDAYSLEVLEAVLTLLTVKLKGSPELPDQFEGN